MSPREQQPGTVTQTKPEAKSERKLARPRLYKVLLHNDDYTTKEFVVAILHQIFHHDEVSATAIMMHVHNHGVGVAGIYTFDVAETKVGEVMNAAEEAEFPLLCTMEPEELIE